jgi:hypothetical protein
MKSAWLHSILIFFLLNQTPFVWTQSGNGVRMFTYSSVESKARQARANDRESIRELSHEVIACRHVHSFPEPVATYLEEKLTDYELQYRNNAARGVSESQVAEILNLLTSKLRMPNYTRTTIRQVREARMKLALMSPQFMGYGLTGNGMHRGDQVHTVMSPLQAFHLLNGLIDQKILNPDYQDPSLDPTVSESERMRAEKSAGSHITVSRKPHSQKEDEVRKSLNSGINALSVQDAFDLINQTLQELSQ